MVELNKNEPYVLTVSSNGPKVFIQNGIEFGPDGQPLNKGAAEPAPKQDTASVATGPDPVDPGLNQAGPEPKPAPAAAKPKKEKVEPKKKKGKGR